MRAEQNFANHRRFDKAYLTAGVAFLLALFLAIAGVLHGVTAASLAMLLLAVGTTIMAMRTRMYAVLLQDRIIRLEMRLRLERILPPEMKDSIPTLTLSQLIGLRFASDDEMPEILKTVLDEKISDVNDIKRRVKNWQADHVRV